MTDDPLDAAGHAHWLGKLAPQARLFSETLTGQFRELGMISSKIAASFEGIGHDPAVDEPPVRFSPRAASMEFTSNAVDLDKLHRLLANGSSIDVGHTHQIVLSWPRWLPYHPGPGKLSRWPGSRASWAAKRRQVTALNRRRRRAKQPTHYPNPQAIVLPRVALSLDEPIPLTGRRNGMATMREMYLSGRLVTPWTWGIS